MKRRLLELAALLLILAGVSCAKPKIGTFDADPQRICKGQTTRLSWKVTGEATLSATSPLPGTGPIASEGQRQFAPDTTTIFVLSVTRGGKQKRAHQEVVVLDTGAPVPIVIATEPDSAGGLVARETAPPEDWDHDLRIALVMNISDRPITVSHGGTEATVGPRVPSDAFQDLPVSGSWTLRADLKEGEEMGNPEHAPPDRLRLELTLKCRERN